MQRLHGWFDQLTTRRRSSRNESEGCRRIASRSVAPSCRLNTEIQKKPQLRAVKVPSPQMNVMTSSTSLMRRTGIRTNPWISPRNYHYARNDEMNESICSLDRRPPSLAVKSIDSSTYSSGYASQDCSPDSSCHMPSWQHNSTENGNCQKWNGEREYSLEREQSNGRFWSQQRSRHDEQKLQYTSANSSSSSIYDNITEEHIYHELELACRRPERSYSSDCLSSECSESPQPRPDSPIYATPWNHYPLILRNKSFNSGHPSSGHGHPFLTPNHSSVGSSPSSFGPNRPRRRLPETPVEHIYAQPNVSRVREESAFSYGNSFFNRVEKQRKDDRIPKTLEMAEEEFLSELNAQISELQQRSCELRSIVERERVRRGCNQPQQQQAFWSRPTLECTFELDL